eukprot:GHUV01024319.1.p2 GENE.GHUV01024319.1~~GHUV01024319.1.p2  ORF type:complete len:102 (+),score=15.62 GHUV01024319.1:737-1042(+)
MSCSSLPSGVSSAGGSWACNAASRSLRVPTPPPNPAERTAASPPAGHSSKPAGNTPAILSHCCLADLQLHACAYAFLYTSIGNMLHKPRQHFLLSPEQEGT